MRSRVLRPRPLPPGAAPPSDVQPRAMQPLDGPFVGRGPELEQLRARLERAFAGASSVAVLVGEPGIGKTSTTLAFAEVARGRGATVLRGSCSEGDWGPPLYPWAEVLRGVVRALGAARVVRALGASAASLGTLVPELAGEEEIASLGSREDRFRLYDAVAQLLACAAEEAPVALILEDLHWADGDTVAVLRHVARAMSRGRFMLLATYRESEIDPRGPLAELLAMLRREADYQRIALRGFALAEVAEYLERTAGRELPVAIVRLIFDETVGNPFYVREVLRHLIEEGKLGASADGSIDAGMRGLGIPVGVREVVGRRLSRLSDDAERVLCIASALTGGADFALLRALSELDDARLLRCLDEARAAGLVRVAAEGRYELAHPIVRRTIYDGQNPDRRARLHRRIAEALESQPLSAGASAAEIAAQYHASLVLPGAEQGVPHARAAAADAERASAHDLAVTLLRLARDLAVTAPAHVRVDVLCALARAEASALLADDVSQTVEDALREMSELGSPREEVAELLATVARELKSGGAPVASWEPLVARGLSLAGKKRDLRWARLKLLEDRVEPIASGAVHVVRLHGRDPQATRIARDRGDEDDYVATVDYAFRTRTETDALLALAKRWPRGGAKMRALDSAARDLVYRHAAFREARAHLRELRDVSERSGSVPGQVQALVELAHCEAALGEVALASEMRMRSQALVARLGVMHRLERVVALGLDTMFAYLFGGDWAAIAQPAARFAADPSAARSPVAHIAAGVAVLGYALAGYAKESRSLLGHLGPVFERCDRLVYNYGVALDCALIAVWHLGATDLAPRYRALAEQAPPEVGMSTFSVRELNIARMRVLVGDPEAAAESLTGAREACDRGGLRPLRAIVDHDEAVALLRADDPALQPRARELLERSLREFRALGMEPWIAHSHQLLGAPRHAYPDDLTAREVEVLRLVAAGRSNKEIATKMLMSTASVQRHIATIFGKTGARDRAEAAAYVTKHRIAR